MSSSNLDKYVSHHDEQLKAFIKTTPIACPRVKEATLYSLFPGGKRFRPLLVYLCGNLLGVNEKTLDTIAIAVELIHCYSLIHDDLPAMDNDDYRRGKLSCHRAFDDATAILVGDGMQALAVEVLLTRLPETLTLDKVHAITLALIQSIGPNGMISGQSMDLNELSGSSIDESRLQNIHQLKTGKLISACIKMAVLASTAERKEIEALEDFASHLGLVFQMQDDYLDHYAEALLGKKRASDKANRKNTYASLFERQELLLRITQHYEHAKQALAPFKQRASDILSLLETLQQRLEQ